MKRLSSSLIIITCLALLAGCKKYLEEEPRKQASIQTVAQLEALVDNAMQFAEEGNSTAALSTDDYEVTRDLYKNNRNAFSTDILQYYIFSVEGVINASADALWQGEYKKIFTANLILENIDRVTGDNAAKERVKADAYFIRGYSNWVLANHYCAPFNDANMGSLGLPLKKTTTYEESLKRATLKDTYDFILSDLTEAQKVPVDDVDPRRAWRISKKAIAAFMSRYYLFTGNYPLSLAEAEKALATAKAKLVDYNTLAPGIPAIYSNPADTLRYIELNSWTPAKFLYWPEFYYTRFTYYSSQWFVPSAGLLALYDQQHDLRYRHFMIRNGGRRMDVVSPVNYRYTIFDDGSELPAGFTVAEVLLNKAEVQARQGDVNGAMTTVNILRQKRMSTYVALSASGREDAVKKVLEERRRELPFAMRWYDIRRFSVNDDPADDVTVTRDFFNVTTTGVDVNTPKTYTLTTKRLVVPISAVEINVSKGEIEQNAY